MKRFAVVILLFAALPVLALDVPDCTPLQQLAALYEVRSLALKRYSSSSDIDHFIDRRLDDFRGPLAGGGFRWVRWTRPTGDAPDLKKGHLAVGVHDRGEKDTFEAGGEHAFAVRIEVPEKRSLFTHNNRVYVGTVHVRYETNGRTRSLDKTIDEWMNPDTSRTIDLETIAERVSVSLDSGAPPDHVREALVEIHILQAVPQDDPANPAYEAIQSLQRVRRDSYDRFAIDDEIARVETQLYPGSDPLPLVRILTELRRADEMLRSKKDDEREKGEKLLTETLRRLH
jgi:hypothetical protein